MKRKLQKLAALLLAGLLIVVGLPLSTAAETADVPAAADQDPLQYGYISVASNEWLELYTAVSGDYVGTFAVRNKADGSMWYSSPLNARDDSVSIQILQMLSMLEITVYDENTNTEISFTSYGDSVLENTLTLRTVKNGLSFAFHFPAAKVTVPVEVVLDGDVLDVNVKVNEIEEKGECRVFDITLLPYFCSGGIKDEGFLLVPDGSGALLHFNNGKTGYGAYSNTVYGGDAVLAAESRPTETENIYLPVFGVKRNTSAMLAVLTGGAAQSTVKAVVSGVDSEQNTIWHTISVRREVNYTLDQGWQGSSSFTIYPDTPPEIDSAGVRYHFLAGENANLAGMARKVKEHMQESDGLLKDADTTTQVVVDALGAVRKKTTFLGFPAWRDQELTSFEAAQSLLSELKDGGVEKLSLRYLGWNKAAVRGKIASSAKPLSLLGGKSDFNALSAYAEKNGVGFYPDVNWLQYSKNNYLLQQYFAAARNANSQLATRFFYKRNLLNKDNALPTYWLLNRKTLTKTVDSFFKSFGKLKFGNMSLSGVGSIIYSDHSGKEALSAEDGLLYQVELLSRAAETTEMLMTEAPFLYAAARSNLVVDIPGASGFDMLDEAVPFYQMVLAGSVSYCGEAINLDDDPEKAFLTALSTGSGLHYALTDENGVDKLKNTAYEHWISCTAVDWIDTVIAQSKAMQEVYADLGSHTLVDYEYLGNGLSRSTFQGGGVLLVNVSDTAVNTDGTEVPARGYVVKGGADNG